MILVPVCYAKKYIYVIIMPKNGLKWSKRSKIPKIGQKLPKMVILLVLRDKEVNKYIIQYYKMPFVSVNYICK